MQKTNIILLVLLAAAVLFILIHQFNPHTQVLLHEGRPALTDSLEARTRSLQSARKEIRKKHTATTNNGTRRKNEVLKTNSIDSLAFLANRLLSGKGH